MTLIAQLVMSSFVLKSAAAINQAIVSQIGNSMKECVPAFFFHLSDFLSILRHYLDAALGSGKNY
jgi:hypothetical protein